MRAPVPPSQPPIVPRGRSSTLYLTQLSVGIEDVDELWADLDAALRE
jgi:cystathionine beta-lyase/cystathionine gamma-synthase